MNQKSSPAAKHPFRRQEHRASIQLRVVEKLSTILTDNMHMYEDDVIDKVLLPCLSQVESDAGVRTALLQLLTNIATVCSGKSCYDIVDALCKVMNHPFEATDTVHVLSECEIMDLRTAVIGLIQVFKNRIGRQPATILLKVFRVLLNQLGVYYHSSVLLQQTPGIRLLIFDCVLSIHTLPDCHLGFGDSDGAFQYTYLHCYSDSPNPSVSSPTPSMSSGSLSLELLFQAISTCLNRERDWQILQLVLKKLPCLLQNKSLLLSAGCTLQCLCTDVCALVHDRALQLPESLQNTTVQFTRSDFHGHVFPILASLVSYHKNLDSGTQCLLVNCLCFGLISKCARICIVGLTVCVLEMRDTMYKLLPDVLLSLSKISATVAIATPILEFLSTLIRLPKLYASFIQDQYMSIFAIALPYTNPFKFNHYVVSLAHHVIAMWFLKCRITFRKGFVKFIMKSLRNNVSLPEDNSKHCDALNTFHLELMDTCMDLLARYTFASCSTLPKRTTVAEFLLSSGQSCSWLVGNSVVTITTSGYGSPSSKYGMCDKCLTLSRGSFSSSAEPTSRRRHHSAIHRTRSNETYMDMGRAKDDIQLRSYGANTDQSATPALCSCWCQGWVEVLVRKPSGNISWVMRIQNDLQLASHGTLPVAELANLLLPRSLSEEHKYHTSVAEVPVMEDPFDQVVSRQRIDSESLAESEYEAFFQQHFQQGTTTIGQIQTNIISDNEGGANLRRISSSPDMNLAWTTALGSSHESSGSEQRMSPSAGQLQSSNGSASERADDVGPMRRDRGHTISVMSPAQHYRPHVQRVTPQQEPKEPVIAGVSPSFVFLQLYHHFRQGANSERPIMLPKNDDIDRALKLLDTIPPYETHKIGIIYIGRNQADNEAAILANEYGSVRYQAFLRGIGELVRLQDVDMCQTYVGGLELNGRDGKYAYVWHDDVMQVIFHVATLMPTVASDPQCNQKKLHIGNNFVTIAYNDSGEDFDINTIKGQFMHACILIQCLERESNLVVLKTKAGLDKLIGTTEKKIVSNENLPTLTRQLALHANLASLILQSQTRSTQDPYASNWLERLRHIKRIRERLTRHDVSWADKSGKYSMFDFTSFV